MTCAACKKRDTLEEGRIDHYCVSHGYLHGSCVKTFLETEPGRQILQAGHAIEVAPYVSLAEVEFESVEQPQLTSSEGI